MAKQNRRAAQPPKQPKPQQQGHTHENDELPPGEGLDVRLILAKLSQLYPDELARCIAEAQVDKLTEENRLLREELLRKSPEVPGA